MPARGCHQHAPPYRVSVEQKGDGCKTAGGADASPQIWGAPHPMNRQFQAMAYRDQHHRSREHPLPPGFHRPDQSQESPQACRNQTNDKLRRHRCKSGVPAISGVNRQEKEGAEKGRVQSRRPVPLTHDWQARILGQARKNWFDRFHKMIGGEFLFPLTVPLESHKRKSGSVNIQ